MKQTICTMKQEIVPDNMQCIQTQDANMAQDEPQYWVDAVRFYRKLDELDLSVNKLAKLTGIAASTLYKKLEMKSQFKLSEIYVLREAMQLSPEEAYWIFFAGYVQKAA